MLASLEELLAFVQENKKGPSLPELVESHGLQDLVVLYHRSDEDGRYSGFLFCEWAKACGLFLTIDARPVQYGVPLPSDLQLGPKTLLVIVDFSYDIPIMQSLESQVGALVWVDHHVNPIKEAAKIGFDPPGVRSVKSPACILSFLYLGHRPDDGPKSSLVYLLGRWDVHDTRNDTPFWDEDDPAYLLHLGLSFQKNKAPCPPGKTAPKEAQLSSVWDDLSHSGKSQEDCCVEGQSLAWVTAAKTKEVLEKSFTLRWMGLVWCAVNVEPRETYQVFKDAVDLSVHQGMLAFYFDPQVEKWRVHLRSCDAIAHQVNGIARSFPGGGGHPGAAGLSAKTLPFLLPGEPAGNANGPSCFCGMPILEKYRNDLEWYCPHCGRTLGLSELSPPIT